MVLCRNIIVLGSPEHGNVSFFWLLNVVSEVIFDHSGRFMSVIKIRYN